MNFSQPLLLEVLYHIIASRNLNDLIFIILGFLTLPTAYVTGNPVECVLHPSLWNDSGVWNAVGVGQMPIGNDDAEYEEENIGYPVSSVSGNTFMFLMNPCKQEVFLSY